MLGRGGRRLARRVVLPIVGGPFGRPDLENGDAAPYDCRPALGTGRRSGEGALHGDAVAHARISSSRSCACRGRGCFAWRCIAGCRRWSTICGGGSAWDFGRRHRTRGVRRRVRGAVRGAAPRWREHGPRGVTWRSTSRDSSTPSRRAADGVPVPVSAIGIRSTRGIARGGRSVSDFSLPLARGSLVVRLASRRSRRPVLDDGSWRRRSGRSRHRRSCRAGRSWCVESRSSRRRSRGSSWPCAARREQAARHKIGQRAENALQRCLMRERRAFLIPVCPPLWKTETDAGCTCSGSARSQGRPVRRTATATR